MVVSAGTYQVTSILDGCGTSGKITVAYITTPATTNWRDTTLCVSEQLILDAACPSSSYLWQDGKTQPEYTVSAPGTYEVTVKNSCGITVDSIKVGYENCACKFYMPDAFTPNGDGKNDIFKPSYKCLFSQYRLRVFNRFGQNIFASQDAGTGWDGTFNGLRQPPGTYIWEIVYFDTVTDRLVKKNGTVVLVR
jgi:gliding motility-associated-like protein